MLLIARIRHNLNTGLGLVCTHTFVKTTEITEPIHTDFNSKLNYYLL